MNKIYLAKQDLRKVEVGTIVVTTNGFEFELMARDEKGKESWKDLVNGLIWHDKEDEEYAHYGAMKKFNESIPTAKEFEEAEAHGFREVLPNMKNYFFWSASLYPNNTDFARVFSGYVGSIGYSFRDNYISVRCVGR